MEVGNVDGVERYDLYLLRAVDVAQMRRANVPLVTVSGQNTDEGNRILAERDNVDPVCDWFARQFESVSENTGARIQAAAAATYLPEISSALEFGTGQNRLTAVNALVNALLICIRLAAKGLMADPIVEIVCGTVFESCGCVECNGERVYRFRVEDKLDLLFESLKMAIDTIYSVEGEDCRFAIGLELEPGSNYILNSENMLRSAMDVVEADTSLSRHVGINLDIAHMRIAQIPAFALTPFRDRIVHSHIADHPGVHTIDQVVGRWTSYERRDSPYSNYVRLLDDCRRTRTVDGLPFSGSIALELEGCNRISWIHHSVPAIRHLCDAAANY